MCDLSVPLIFLSSVQIQQNNLIILKDLTQYLSALNFKFILIIKNI